MKVPLIQEPVDTWKAAYIICFVEGLGMLFPWNTFITASAYYQSRLCETSFHHNFENFFGISFNLMNSVGVILALFYQHRVSQRNRVLVPLGMCTIIFGVTCLLVTIDHLDGNVLFAITIACVILAAANISLLQGGMFGLAAQLPPIYTQAVMAGQGLAGAAVSLVSIAATTASSSSSGDDDSVCTPYTTDWASFAYFLVSCVILFGSWGGYFILERLPFVQYHTSALDVRRKLLASSSKASQRSGVSINSNEPVEVLRPDDAAPLMQQVDDPETDEFGENSLRPSLPLSTTPKLLDSLADLPDQPRDSLPVPSSKRSEVSRSSRQASRSSTRTKTGRNGTVPEEYETNGPLISPKQITSEDDDDERGRIMSNKEVFLRIRSLALGVGYCFLITLMLFPSVASKMASVSHSSNRFFSDLWTPFIFLMFNLWDFVGRAILAPWKTFMRPDRLWIASFCRTIFIPLFLLCKLSSPGETYTLFDHDAWPIIFMSLFGVTNGYLSSQLMMYAPMRVGDIPQNQLKAGTMMVLCLVLGLTVGALLSFALLPYTG